MNNPLLYDHLPYIIAAYALFLAAASWFAIGTGARLALVERRLRAADPRARKSQSVS